MMVRLHSIRRAVLLALALGALMPVRTEACSPVKVIDIVFPFASAVVSAGQVSRLAHWLADLRVRYPNQESIDIGASAEPGERNPEDLASARARNVAEILTAQLGFERQKVYLPLKVYVRAPATNFSKPLERAGDVKGVQLDFLPACPHECPCQRGDALYQPPVKK